MAKEQIAPVTMNVSRKFLTVITDLARSNGESVREYCDRVVLPFLKPKFVKLNREKLESVDVGGEG